MKHWICLPVLVLALSGCAGKTVYRDTCANQLDAAWKEFSRGVHRRDDQLLVLLDVDQLLALGA